MILLCSSSCWPFVTSRTTKYRSTVFTMCLPWSSYALPLIDPLWPHLQQSIDRWSSPCACPFTTKYQPTKITVSPPRLSPNVSKYFKSIGEIWEEMGPHCASLKILIAIKWLRRGVCGERGADRFAPLFCSKWPGWKGPGVLSLSPNHGAKSHGGAMLYA
jgi:hypothetical protein